MEVAISFLFLFIYLFIYLFVYLFIYLFIYERQSTSWGWAEREGDTESVAGSRVRAVSTEPDAGLKLRNREIMT